MLSIPIGFSSVIGEGPHNWNYQSVEEDGLDGRCIPLPRGRVLGGTSAINGMVYIRGQAQDYDDWAALGNEGWGWSDVLPLFRRAEDHWRGESELHGADGPLRIRPVACRFDVADAFIQSASQLGMPVNEDFNGADQAGAGYFDTTIHRGRRWSAARAYLDGVPRAGQLDIAHGVDVTGLVMEGARATGIRAVRRGRQSGPQVVRADRDIVLCAGAFNTPRLLELSGIGDADRLGSLGIPVIADLPGVGENLQDHCNSYIYSSSRGCRTYYDFVRPSRLPLTLLKYLYSRGGIFANPAALAGAFFELDGGDGRPDTQVHFAAAAGRPDASGKLVPVPGICASICQLRSDARGSSHIVSSDPLEQPRIETGFLASESDLARQVLAVQRLREIFAAAPLAGFLGEELEPLAGQSSEPELRSAIRQSAESVHHPVGTCRMGIDGEAVVDPSLRVRGVDGLHVADASIMPRIISGNTHAACVMIGERMADMLLPP
jgi:choline dehydrogenase